MHSRSLPRGHRSSQGSQAGPINNVSALTRLCAMPQAGEVAKEMLREFQGKYFHFPIIMLNTLSTSREGNYGPSDVFGVSHA